MNQNDIVDGVTQSIIALVPCPRCDLQARIKVRTTRSYPAISTLPTDDLESWIAVDGSVLRSINRDAPFSCSGCGALFQVGPDGKAFAFARSSTPKHEPPSDKKVIVMRGASGSGKSTRAFAHAYNAAQTGKRACTVSADDFFMRDGKYEFVPSKLGQAHADCLKRFIQALYEGVDVIIVDNTNTRVWEFDDYVKLALVADYDVKLDESRPKGDAEVRIWAERCVHGVPFDKVKQQDQRFEAYDLAAVKAGFKR